MLALAIGKPIAIILTVWAAGKARIALPAADAAPLAFLGAAFLCGIADPFSFYLAEQAFQTGAYASVAKLGVLAGSGMAAAFGALLLALSPTPVTAATRAATRTVTSPAALDVGCEQAEQQ